MLYANREERNAVNEKQLLALVLDWIRKLFDANGSNVTLDTMTEKIFMLYFNKSDRRLHDCEDIEAGDSNHTDVVQEYKRISRKLSFSNSKQSSGAATNGSNTAATAESAAGDANATTNPPSAANGNPDKALAAAAPVKPPRQLFTRSDSDSSLSSLADDDETDWKVLATHQTLDSKHTIMGLVMLAGKVVVLTVKKRLNDPNRVESTDDVDKEDEQTVAKDSIACAAMSTARCAAGTVALNGKLFVCGGYDRGECMKSAELYDQHTNTWSALAPMKYARGRFDVCVVNDKV